MQWDIFCRVIDNHGDLGVCWRLSSQLAALGERVRLWIDDATALHWMAPAGCEGVSVVDWLEPAAIRQAVAAPPPDVLVEAFGCEPAPELIARFAEPQAAGGRAEPGSISNTSRPNRTSNACTACPRPCSRDPARD